MPFSATLLAGGKSTRMGRDKAALPFGGGLLWEHQVDTLKNAGAAEILISGPANDVYAGSNYPIISDVTPDCGPIGGLQAALRHAKHGHVLLLAVDLPDMTPAYLRQMWTYCAEGHGAVARGDAYEPLAAFYPREVLPLVEKQIVRGEYSFQEMLAEAELLGMMRAVPIASEELPLFRNWNAP